MSDVRNRLQEQYPEIPFLFMDPPEQYDGAIMGVVTGSNIRPVIAYDYARVVAANIAMGMTYDEAIEYFEYNQGNAYVGEGTPVFVETLGE